jgi:hypothetical protein
VTPDLLPPEVWAAEGMRAAPALSDVTAAIVTGRDPAAAAQVALGMARFHARERRVAVADLVGGLHALTPLADQAGLLECLRDGEPISAIGQPLAGADGVYLLPSGRGPIAERWVFESARWERLIAGFREVDALLLLVAPPGAPGLERLIARVDGVVAVDLPPRDVRAWPLLATIDHPEPELPPIPVKRPTTPDGTPIVPSPRIRRRRWGRWAALALALLAGSAWGLQRAGRVSFDFIVVESDTDSLEAVALPPPPAEQVEIALGPIVNPGDSANALTFAVEVVAANTLASANSRLVSPAAAFPASTVAPVVLRSGSPLWYRAIVGAWPTRQEAEAWLGAQRSTGILRASAGRVVATPFALLLEEGRGADVAATIARWEQLGVRAYGLQQANGSVRIFAGAFETAAQAVWLASTLRDLGTDPQVAYRTGRMF